MNDKIATNLEGSCNIVIAVLYRYLQEGLE